MNRLRSFGRWLADWRTGAVITGSVLVALLAVVVVDSIQARRDADRQRDAVIRELEVTVTELQRRGQRIDALAGQLEDATSSRDRLAEEVRALREMLIDRGVIEPRALAATPTPTSTQGRAAPTPSASPSPAPAPAPSPEPEPQPSPTPTPTPCPGREVLGLCLPL